MEKNSVKIEGMIHCHNKLYAFLGFIGGVSFMIGDCLLYCYKGYSSADIDPLWSGVAEWRFVLSAWLGFLGMALMLPAFYSYYRMIEKTCGKILKVMATFMGIGVASTGFLQYGSAKSPSSGERICRCLGSWCNSAHAEILNRL